MFNVEKRKKREEDFSAALAFIKDCCSCEDRMSRVNPLWNLDYPEASFFNHFQYFTGIVPCPVYDIKTFCQGSALLVFFCPYFSEKYPFVVTASQNRREIEKQKGVGNLSKGGINICMMTQ